MLFSAACMAYVNFTIMKYDGRKTCDFMSHSTVFHPYHNDETMKMKGGLLWNPDYGCRFAGFGSESAR